MNANYQYCKNVADDSVYCQYLKKDSEGNAISYRIARQQGTYTQERFKNMKYFQYFGIIMPNIENCRR